MAYTLQKYLAIKGKEKLKNGSELKDTKDITPKSNLLYWIISLGNTLRYS